MGRRLEHDFMKNEKKTDWRLHSGSITIPVARFIRCTDYNYGKKFQAIERHIKQERRPRNFGKKKKSFGFVKKP